MGSSIDISIIIPAYNAQSTIGRAIDSVLNQDYPREKLEVLVIDDCSTDATRDVVDRFVCAYPHTIQVEHLKSNSGSAAAPRNLGIERSKGKYIFFLDADDWLENNAIPRMLSYAQKWDSDLVLVRMASTVGREVPSAVFDGNHESIDVFHSAAMWTFGPMKLIRKTLVDAHNLHFPGFMPEDISFMLRAYYYAKKVSVISDKVYYYCGAENSSLATWDNLESNLEAFSDVLSFTQKHIPQEKQTIFLKRVFWRDVYHMALASAKHKPEKQLALLRRIRNLFEPFDCEDIYVSCPLETRIVLEALFHADLQTAQNVVRAAAQKNLDHLYQLHFTKGRLSCNVVPEVGHLSFDVTRSFVVNAQPYRRLSQTKRALKRMAGVFYG